MLADAEQVAVLVGQLGYQRSLEDVRRWIEALGSEGARQAAFVACLGEEVVGWIEVSIQRHLQTAPSALIGGLVVKDGVRGKRIGRRLCEQAETWGWRQGLDAVRVTSRSTREDAHRFYLQNGYSRVKTSEVFEKSCPADTKE